MAHFDGYLVGVNPPGVPRRTKSGVMPAMSENSAHWAEVSAAAELLAIVAGRAEAASVDAEERAAARGVREAAELVIEASRARAAG